MGKMPWATYFWPGLPQLWCRGVWTGLVLAVGFGVLVDLVLLASFVWVEVLSPFHVRVGWLAVGSLWCISVMLSVAAGLPKSAPRSGSTEGLFREALSEYLQGSWFEAEMALGQLLRHDPRDVEGRLLLATLLRHSSRYGEALEHLDRLERLRDAQKWHQEITAERREITQATRANEPSEPLAGPASQQIECRNAA
jgi:hypothetical protein